MKPLFYIKIFSVSVISIILIYSYKSLKDRADYMKIDLRWNKGYREEAKDDIITGLAWSFSFLGAMLPKDQ